MQLRFRGYALFSLIQLTFFSAYLVIQNELHRQHSTCKLCSFNENVIGNFTATSMNNTSKQHMTEFISGTSAGVKGHHSQNLNFLNAKIPRNRKKTWFDIMWLCARKFSRNVSKCFQSVSRIERGFLAEQNAGKTIPKSYLIFSNNRNVKNLRNQMAENQLSNRPTSMRKFAEDASRSPNVRLKGAFYVNEGQEMKKFEILFLHLRKMMQAPSFTLKKSQIEIIKWSEKNVSHGQKDFGNKGIINTS